MSQTWMILINQTDDDRFRGGDRFIITMRKIEDTDLQEDEISDENRFMNVQVFRVDLRQAVIYSEILNRAYV